MYISLDCSKLIVSLTLVCIQDETKSSLKTLVPKFLTAKEFLLLDLSKMEELPFVLFITMVLIFCVEFQELSHLTRDLSQAEKKITVATS